MPSSWRPGRTALQERSETLDEPPFWLCPGARLGRAFLNSRSHLCAAVETWRARPWLRDSLAAWLQLQHSPLPAGSWTCRPCTGRMRASSCPWRSCRCMRMHTHMRARHALLAGKPLPAWPVRPVTTSASVLSRPLPLVHTCEAAQQHTTLVLVPDTAKRELLAYGPEFWTEVPVPLTFATLVSMICVRLLQGRRCCDARACVHDQWQQSAPGCPEGQRAASCTAAVRQQTGRHQQLQRAVQAPTGPARMQMVGSAASGRSQAAAAAAPPHRCKESGSC